MLQVKVINKSSYPLPAYEKLLSAGMDVRANIDSPILLTPGDRCLIKTGLFIGLPEGYECQVRPRSGLALKHGITVLNSPGTVDAGFCDEIGVILINHSREAFRINPGDRIAQFVIAKHETVEWVEVEELDGFDRGGGFGHTGMN